MISQDLSQSQDCQLNLIHENNFKKLQERDPCEKFCSFLYVYPAMGEVASERKKAALQKEVDG
jgi:hypothetical protein